MKPYSSWEDFRKQIKDAFDSYLEIGEPVGVKRIGLRYINKIEILNGSIKLDDYFVSPPQTPNGFPDAMTNIFSRIESVYGNDEPIRLIFTFATTDTVATSDSDKKNCPTFILDFDVVWEKSEASSLDLANTLKLMDDLRNKERDAFELFITDKTRGIFNA